VIYRRVLYIGLVPAGLLSLNFWWNGTFESNYGWLIFWIVIVLLFATIYWKNFRYFVSEEGIRISSAVIAKNETLLKWYKIQGVEIQQGIYQRRKNLCNIVFHTAAGTVKIPYIEIEKAKRIENFVLYKIESSNQKWM